MNLGFLSMAVAIGLLSLLIMGLPVAVALGITGLVGIIVETGWGSWVFLTGGAALHNLSHFGLLAIPLFVLMGTYVTESGMGPLLIEFATRWFNKFPGYLHTTSIAACGIFASMSGSSIATAAAIGGVVLPEMKKRGQNMRLGMGAVAAGGTLGIIIPPSNHFILYGVLTETSISKLFIAGVIPGLILIFSFIAFNTVYFSVKPDTNAAAIEDFTWVERWQSLRKIWTGLILIVSVLGGIFFGIVTPTEAAALGALVALLLGLFVLRGLTFYTAHRAAIKAVQVTAMVGFIILGGLILGRGMTLLNLSGALIDMISDADLNRWVVLLLVNLFLLFLGLLMDAAAITLITIPLIFPLIISLGFDPIWFGVIFGLNMELALISPPVGMNLFVIKAITGEKMIDAIMGTLPYALILTACIVLIAVVPELTTWLPSKMF